MNEMIIKKIKVAISKSSKGQNEIGRLAGIKQGNFSRFLHGHCGLSVKKLDKLFKILELRITEKLK